MKKGTRGKAGSAKSPVKPMELHPKAVAFEKSIRTGWPDLDEAAEGYLRQAIENLSVATIAQETIKAEGMIVTTRTGYKLPHPAWRIAKESSALFMRALNGMGLDIEASGPMGRPSGK